jgi:hypothetical protein
MSAGAGPAIVNFYDQVAELDEDQSLPIRLNNGMDSVEGTQLIRCIRNMRDDGSMCYPKYICNILIAITDGSPSENFSFTIRKPVSLLEIDGPQVSQACMCINGKHVQHDPAIRIKVDISPAQ